TRQQNKLSCPLSSSRCQRLSVGQGTGCIPRRPDPGQRTSRTRSYSIHLYAGILTLTSITTLTHAHVPLLPEGDRRSTTRHRRRLCNQHDSSRAVETNYLDLLSSIPRLSPQIPGTF